MLKVFRNILMSIVSLFLKSLSLIIPKQKNLILLGGFAGNRFGDNSASLYTFLLKYPKEYEVFWMFNKKQVIKEVNAIGGKALKRRSLNGIWKTLRANLIITSHGIKDVLMYIPVAYKPKMIYLNHGIPLKKGWVSIKNSPKKSVQSSKEKIKCSNFMIATSEFSKNLQNEFLPVGIDKIRITGLPRNDVFFQEPGEESRKLISTFNLSEFKYKILYAPTWREGSSTQFFPFLDLNISQIAQFLQDNNIAILIRPHHIDLNKKDNQPFWKEISKYNNFKIVTHSHCPDVNQICVISDCLITDYSSVYFDYLLTDNPVIFFPYDFEEYSKEVGFIVDYNKIACGPWPETQKVFLNTLKDLINSKDTFKQQRKEIRNQIHTYQDGNSCARTVHLIKELINEKS